MILRAATSSDAAALASVHREAFARPWSGADIAELMASPGAFTLAAVAPGGLAGFILCRILTDDAEVLTLATASAHRRTGVATALVEAAGSLAAAGGATSLFLEVAADNAAAIALYAARGFIPVGERRGYYARPGGAASALVLRRDLNRRVASPYDEGP